MNNKIWHEAVVVVRKTEKCKNQLITHSDSDKYTEKKNRRSCKNCHKSKKQKKKQTWILHTAYVRHNIIAIISD